MFSLRAAATTRSSIPRALIRRAYLSSDCAPAQRIRQVLNEYRLAHYSQELPSRFKKECVKAIATGDGNSVQVDSLNLILNNIGRQDACLSEDELLQLLQELGAEANTRTVSVEKIMQLM